MYIVHVHESQELILFNENTMVHMYAAHHVYIADVRSVNGFVISPDLFIFVNK